MEETPHPPREPLRKRVGKQLRLPRLSGKVSAACLVLCFALTAILIPTLLNLPLWIEFEIVLAIWWLVWLIVLARLLYTHQFVEDDHTLSAPRKWINLSKRDNSDGGGWSFFDGVGWGADDGEAVAVGCAIVVSLILLFFALWFLIEVAIPLVLFLLYFIVRGMLARVVNDRHGCQGHLGKALGWAAVWATAYTAPLALVVWILHVAHTKPPIMAP